MTNLSVWVDQIKRFMKTIIILIGSNGGLSAQHDSNLSNSLTRTRGAVVNVPNSTSNIEINVNRHYCDNKKVYHCAGTLALYVLGC